MAAYEFKVVPAPRQGLKGRGLRATEDRFAHALETVMNQMGAQGWDYVRADTLPCEERQGLTGRATVFQNMLVFRRPLAAASAETGLRPAGSSTPLPAPVIVPPAGRTAAAPAPDAGPGPASQVAAE
jgi:hypothetical protein